MNKRTLFWLACLLLGGATRLNAADAAAETVNPDKLLPAFRFTAWNYDLLADGETNTFYVHPRPVQGAPGLWVVWPEKNRVLIVRPEPGEDAYHNPGLDILKTYPVGKDVKENERPTRENALLLQRIQKEALDSGQKIEVVNPSLSRMVLASTNHFDLTADLQKEGLTRNLPAPETLGLLADILGRKPDYEPGWEALRFFLQQSAGDPALGERFMGVIEKRPLLFYTRYMRGDDRALDAMSLAFNWDYAKTLSAQPVSLKASPTHRRVKAIFKTCLNQVRESREWLKKPAEIERHKRASKFLEDRFAAWCRRYGDAPSDY